MKNKMVLGVLGLFVSLGVGGLFMGAAAANPLDQTQPVNQVLTVEASANILSDQNTNDSDTDNQNNADETASEDGAEMSPDDWDWKRSQCYCVCCDGQPTPTVGCKTAKAGREQCDGLERFCSQEGSGKGKKNPKECYQKKE